MDVAKQLLLQAVLIFLNAFFAMTEIAVVSLSQTKLKKMEEDLGDIWADVEKGDLSRVTGWLKEHIHRHASFIKPGALFESVCGKFDATYYTDYLTEKYTRLYNL